MKKVFIFLVILTGFLSCSITKQAVIVQPPVLKVENPIPEVKLVKIKKPVQIDNFKIIDTFEKGIDKWKQSATYLSKLSLAETKGRTETSHGLAVRYQLKSARAFTVDSDKISIAILKKHSFTKYKGLTFFAKGQGNLKMKLSLYEQNEWANGLNPVEIWSKMIKLTPHWKKYKVYFSNLKSEEYYEQDFVGDQILDLSHTQKIGVSIDNSKPLDSASGTIFLDDIYLF